MVLTNVYGAALTDPRDHRRARRAQGPPAAHRLGRRPPRAAGLALLRHEVRGDRDGRGRAAGASTAPACG